MMFKTVKVGDTSLQYTIVSQTDDSSGGSNAVNISPTIRKSKVKRKTRHRKTVILVLVTMIMGCGIVIAAVLVPILVASKLVSNLPESAKFKTFAIAASSIQGYGKYDQNGHKYVELLPIKQPPLDSVIEFQDEISISHNIHTRPKDERLHSGSDTSSYHKEAPTTAMQPLNSNSTSSKVTIHYNNTKNVASSKSGFQRHQNTSNRSATSNFFADVTTLLIKNIFLMIFAFVLSILFLIVVGCAYCRIQKSRLQKVERQEDKAQRNQLLTAIPMEDD